jgi:DNA-binding transcriptional LysR family regulator
VVEIAAADEDVEATRLNRVPSGSIKVTAPEAMMTHAVSPIILFCRAQHPVVRSENPPAENRVSLEKGEADIGFRASRVLTGDTLISLRLPGFKWGVYCSEDYIQRNGKPHRRMT